MLPIFKDPNTNLMLMQNRWSSDLNPLLSNKLNQGFLLKKVSLQTGANVINHGLARLMVGWIIADIDSSASVYRSAPLNALTLTLTSSAPANVELWVF